MTASEGGNNSPRDPADVRSPVVNFGVYFRSRSIGNKSPPIARMVTPLPPVKLVKNAHTTMATIAKPPGSQPTSARKSSTSLRGVPPSARMKPARVKSGIVGRIGLIARLYVSVGIAETGKRSCHKSTAATPPMPTKIGAPSAVAATKRSTSGK